MVKIVDENIQPLAPPNFVSRAGLSTPDLSTAKFVEGVGNLAFNILNAIDFFQQKDIKEEISTEIDTITGELEKELGSIDVLEKQKKQGIITPEQYWLRLNTLVKNLKKQYPGQSDFIDSYISRKTGRLPANAIRDLYFKALNENLKEQQDETERLLRENKQLLRTLVTTGVPVEQELIEKVVNTQDAEQQKKIQQELFRLVNRAKDIDYKKKVLDFVDKSTTVEKEKKLELANSVAANHLSSFVSRKLLLAEGNPLLEAQKKAMEDGVIDANEIKQLQNTAYLLEQQYRQELHQLFYSAPKGKEKSVASIIGSEEANKIIEDNVKYFRNMFIEPILGGNFKLIDYNKQILEALEENDRLLWMRDPLLRAGARIKENLGQEAAKVFLERNFVKFQDKANALVSLFETSQSLGLNDEEKPQPVSKTIERAINNATPKEKQKVALNILEQVRNVLYDKTVPIETKLNAFISLFGKENENFFENVSPKDRKAIFDFLINPQTTKAIEELSNIDPKVKSQFVTWLQKSFYPINSISVNTIKELTNTLKNHQGILSSNVYVDENGKLILDVLVNPNIPVRAGGARYQLIQELQKEVDSYNNMIDNFYKTLKALGFKNPENFVNNIQKIFGFKKKPEDIPVPKPRPKEKVLEQLVDRTLLDENKETGMAVPKPRKKKIQDRIIPEVINLDREKPVTLDEVSVSPEVIYKIKGKTRNYLASEKVEKALVNAVDIMKQELGGDFKIIITSAKQKGKRRTGSPRHDTGLAVDIIVLKDGKRVTIKDRETFKKVIKALKKAGFSSIGHYNNFFHVDMAEGVVVRYWDKRKNRWVRRKIKRAYWGPNKSRNSLDKDILEILESE